MIYEVRLDNFTGPLDLLLFFIRRRDIDIMDIPIAQITEEYLAFIEAAQTLNVALAGEFLLMAATLMRIKARMLLPLAPEDEEVMEDPRTELVQQLLEYQRFKEAAENLERLAESERRKFTRPDNPDYRDSEMDPGIYLENISVFDLVQIFERLLKRMPPALTYRISREEISVKEKIAYLLTKFVEKRHYMFSELLATFRSRQDLIATFIAVLEMIKEGQMKVTQRSVFSDFSMERISADPQPADGSGTIAEA